MAGPGVIIAVIGDIIGCLHNSISHRVPGGDHALTTGELRLNPGPEPGLGAP